MGFLQTGSSHMSKNNQPHFNIQMHIFVCKGASGRAAQSETHKHQHAATHVERRCVKNPIADWHTIKDIIYRIRSIDNTFETNRCPEFRAGAVGSNYFIINLYSDSWLGVMGWGGMIANLM